MENNNTTKWIIAVVVILAVAVIAWWYIGKSTPEETGTVSVPQAALEGPGTEEQVTAPAPDTTSEIQKDLDAADADTKDLQGELDAFDADIQKGF